MIWKALVVIISAFSCYQIRLGRSRRRKRRFHRGRQLNRIKPESKRGATLRWGPLYLPESSATQHFLTVGTTGSGKSVIQRILMKDVLRSIHPSSDRRVLIFDAKNDAIDFLRQIDVSCPVLNLNPFSPESTGASRVSWHIAADITSPARALNLAAALIPSEKNGNNRYFTDSARQVLSAVIESFVRHSGEEWTFSELVHTTLSLQRVKDVLKRDPEGRETLSNFFGDERTGYYVFTTIVSRMSYFRPVADQWRLRRRAISLRYWLNTESILLIGMNATADTALAALNEIMFRVLVEEVDMQGDSYTRRTWFWIDEARLSGPLLRNKMLPYLAVKGRSKGACLLIAFQDIDGFREAAGPRIANEIIAQCSHKALLRIESDETAAWASRIIGQYETLDVMKSKQGGLFGTGSDSEQATKRDAVLPSEFFLIPIANLTQGVAGYFLSPTVGAVYQQILPKSMKEVIALAAHRKP